MPAARAAVPTTPSNADVARLLRHVGDLLERSGGEKFRVMAWRRAARAVDALRDPVAARVVSGDPPLREIPGVGERLASAIEEIVRTGTLRALEDLRRRAPPPWIELARVKGVGAVRAQRAARQLAISSLAEMAEAARAGRLRGVPGFGPVLERKVAAEIERMGTAPLRVHAARAERSAHPLLAAIRRVPGVERAEIAGSLRRGAATVGDANLVVATRDPAAVAERIAAALEVVQVVERGDRRLGLLLGTGLVARIVICDPRDFGAALYAATGSAAHLVELRPILEERSLSLDEQGLRRAGRRVAAPDEAAVARAMRLPLVPPELREGRGEVAAAMRGALPRLVTQDDVRGDLQVHSTDSDGSVPLEAMAEAARERGLEYVAITDHTQTLRVANGMDRRGFLRQMKAIDALNRRLRGFTVLKGAEVDILRDGSLDLEDDVLAALDVVLVSIHSAFDLPEEEQTERVLRAVSHPSVDVFAHPRGRRIGRREGARFDLDRVARECAARGVMLEADATPERQDLDDEGIRVALAARCRVVVSTDAHSPAELDATRYGINQLRRAGAEPRHVANTLPVDEFRQLLHAAR